MVLLRLIKFKLMFFNKVRWESYFKFCELMKLELYCILLLILDRLREVKVERFVN